MVPSISSITARPPPTRTKCSSCHPTFCSGSCRRELRNSGRSPASSDRSAVRAARLADRTDANVAIVGQSAMHRGYGRRLRRRHAGGLLEAELLDGGLPHLELLHLACDGHRELVGDMDVARDLVVRDPTFAERPQLAGVE